MPDLEALRAEGQRRGLRRADLVDDPLEQFRRWFDERRATESYNADAMVLATADEHGRPSARFVLLKGIDAASVVFFTNYESRKGRELAANPQAALCFGWIEIERQARMVGAVEPLSRAASDAYFATRARGSQLGAWASSQSRPVTDRAELERAFAEADERFGSGPVPRPPYWGGYRLTPDEVELWQGRPDRLHDRFRYRRPTAADGPGAANSAGWVVERLAP